MREINVDIITDAVKELCINANYFLSDDIKDSLVKFKEEETWDLAKDVLDKIITVAPKGFGSENMSKIKMLKPADGIDGVKEFIIDTVKAAGPNPCPPMVIGVGIGGTFDKAAYLAKKALIRSIDESNKNEFYKELEVELLETINKLGIGPQGFGGRTTAIGLNIETYPTHIAGLPVAVNINCHATRHKEIIL